MKSIGKTPSAVNTPRMKTAKTDGTKTDGTKTANTSPKTAARTANGTKKIRKRTNGTKRTRRTRRIRMRISRRVPI